MLKRLSLAVSLSLPLSGAYAVERPPCYPLGAPGPISTGAPCPISNNNIPSTAHPTRDTAKFEAYRERLKARKLEARLRKTAIYRARVYAANRKPNRGCAGGRITYIGKATPQGQYKMLKGSLPQKGDCRSGSCPSPYKDQLR